MSYKAAGFKATEAAWLLAQEPAPQQPGGPKSRLAPNPDWEIPCFRHLPDWPHFPIRFLSVLAGQPDCIGIPIGCVSRLAPIPDLLFSVICPIALSSRLDSSSRLALFPDCPSLARLHHNPDWFYICGFSLLRWSGLWCS